MPAYINSAAKPRLELAAIVREGRGLNKSNIHQLILPPMPVNKQLVHLLKAKISNAQIARIMDDFLIAAPGAQVERMSMSIDDDTFSLVIRKREVQIPDEVEMTYAEYLSMEQLAAQNAGESVELTTEYLTALAMQSTSIFGSATNSIVAYTAANLATIDVVGDVYAATEKMRDKGELADTWIMSLQVYKRIRQATLLKNFVVSQLGKGYEVNQSNLQLAFADVGIKQVLIGSSQYNTAADGDTPVFTRMWGNTTMTICSAGTVTEPDEGGIETIPGVGVNAYWDLYTPEGGYGVDTYREENKESNIVRAKTSKAPYIGNPNAGTLIATQYS